MIIRTFLEADRKAIIELWQACDLTRPWNDPDKDIDRKIAFQSEFFFVGEISGEIICTAMAGYDGHRASVYYLAVHPKHQKMAYGQALMSHIEQVLIELGCPKLNIAVRSSNTGVLSFYSKLDYHPDDVLCLGKRLIPDT